MTKTVWILFFCVWWGIEANAQNTYVRHQVWLGAFGQFKLKGRWSLWLDGQFRTMDNFYAQISTLAVRNGIIYRPVPALRLVVGYAYFNIASLRGILPAPHEHRGWQMIQWTHNTAKTRFILGIRAEQRFRERPLQGSHSGEYVFNHRFRYNLNVNIKLNKTKYWVIGNEFMHNIGKEIIYNKFDQNRSWTGIEHIFSPKLRGQILYMVLYQHLPRPNETLTSHNIRITLFRSE